MNDKTTAFFDAMIIALRDSGEVASWENWRALVKAFELVTNKKVKIYGVHYKKGDITQAVNAVEANHVNILVPRRMNGKALFFTVGRQLGEAARKLQIDVDDKKLRLLLDSHVFFEPLINNRIVDFGVQSIIVPHGKVEDGIIVKANYIVWKAIVERLKLDFREAFDIPSRVWEELIASCFERAGYDEVILTPRSGDHGRDVIATKSGRGSIRILGSVKAYAPGHLVTKEEVHALMGVVALDLNASKGIFATTSSFAPKIFDDPRLSASVPNRIELWDGTSLQSWMSELLSKS